MVTRSLVLIRHAKSGEGPVDTERTLAPRGVRDAHAVGAWLSTAGVVPDHVVVSPARRARDTWSDAAAELTDSPEPVVDERLYDNEVDALLDVVRETPAHAHTLVLVGHNPSFGEFAYRLDDGAGNPEARRDLAAGFPTSAVAVFEVGCEWPDVALGGLTLRSYAAPRG